MSDIAIPDWVRPGTVYRIDFGKGHFATRNCHIRAIVDGDYVVSRFWSYKRRGWVYEIEMIVVLLDRARGQHFKLLKVGTE